MALANPTHLNSIDQFLNYQDETVAGSLWVVNAQDSIRQKPFEWFDYLFDGTLKKQYHVNSERPYALFMTNQFNRPHALALIDSSSQKLPEHLKQFQSMIKEKSKVFVLSKMGEALPYDITKKLNNVELIHYTY